VARAFELAKAGMGTASGLAHALGVITDGHPVPSLVPAVPALPMHSGRRAE
jgi:hypothetical protein